MHKPTHCSVVQKFVSHFKGKDKIHPRTGHKGPEGEQMYSSTLPPTLALDGGGWSTPRPSRFTPRKDPVPIVQEAGWAPGPVWMGAITHFSSYNTLESPQPCFVPICCTPFLLQSLLPIYPTS